MLGTQFTYFFFNNFHIFAGSNNKRMKRIAIIALLLAAPLACRAQLVDDWFVDIIGEEQFNTRNGRWNFSSMLEYGIDFNLWEGAQLNVDATASYMQREMGYVSQDPLLFSNIDAESGWLRFAVLGLSQQIGNVTLFAGVRNTDSDYFAEDELWYFLGTMHGVQHVVFGNTDIPTFPTSALSLHGSWEINDHVLLKTTLFNGRSGEKAGDEFRLGDGVTNITAVNWHPGKRSAELGFATGKDWEGEKVSFNMYAYDIERLTDKLSLIGEFGYSFTDNWTYASNAALGALYNFSEKHSLGAIVSTVQCEDRSSDTSLEVNYGYTAGPVTLQPVLVLDDTDGRGQLIGVLRLTVSL